MALAELAALYELGSKTANWVKEALATKRSREARRSILLLREAAILTASLLTLDSAYRKIVSQLMLVSPSWTDQRRDELKEQILEFATQDSILDELRKSYSALKQHVAQGVLDDDERTYVETLMDCGRTVLHGLQGKAATPWESLDVVQDLLQHITDAKSPQQVSALAQDARHRLDGMLGLMDREIVWLAEDKYSMLEAHVLLAHDLPPPDWSTAPLRNI